MPKIEVNKLEGFSSSKVFDLLQKESVEPFFLLVFSFFRFFFVSFGDEIDDDEDVDE